jgi:hypothetical protein
VDEEGDEIQMSDPKPAIYVLFLMGAPRDQSPET